MNGWKCCAVFYGRDGGRPAAQACAARARKVLQCKVDVLVGPEGSWELWAPKRFATRVAMLGDGFRTGREWGQVDARRTFGHRLSSHDHFVLHDDEATFGATVEEWLDRCDAGAFSDCLPAGSPS